MHVCMCVSMYVCMIACISHGNFVNNLVCIMYRKIIFHLLLLGEALSFDATMYVCIACQCMDVYVCVCMYVVYVRVCMYVCMLCMSVYVCMDVYVRVSVYVRVCVCMYVCMYVCM